MSGESEQGLSIFEWMDDPRFPTVRRHGYDTVAVDAYVRSHATDPERARRDATAIREECDALRREIARLTSDLSAAGVPTDSALAWQVAETLIDADTRAKQALADGDAAADEIRRRAGIEVTALHKRVERELDAIRTARLDAAERDHAAAQREAAEIRAAARTSADSTVSEARQYADQRMRAAQEEAGRLRSETIQAADEARAVADAELAEARRDIEAQRNVQQRDERESHHATRRRAQELADVAEARVRDIEDRARASMAHTREHHDATRAEADQLLRRARRRAEQIRTEAKTAIAHQVTAEVFAIERRETRLIADIERYQRREDGMRARIAELREMSAQLRGIEHESDDDSHAE